MKYLQMNNQTIRIYQEYWRQFSRFQRLAQTAWTLRTTQIGLSLTLRGQEISRNLTTTHKLKPNQKQTQIRKEPISTGKKGAPAQFNKWAKANRTEGKQIDMTTGYVHAK